MRNRAQSNTAASRHRHMVLLLLRGVPAVRKANRGGLLGTPGFVPRLKSPPGLSRKTASWQQQRVGALPLRGGDNSTWKHLEGPRYGAG